VISVLDGIYDIKALRVSYFFSSGNQKRGLAYNELTLNEQESIS
jgi:hypothetical protein